MPPLPRKKCDIKNQFTASYSPANFFAEKAMMASKLNWQDVLEIKEYCNEFPIYLKGITAIEDALKAYEVGFSGVFVSNHGGRINDDTIAAIDALMPITTKIKDTDFDVFIDGGFRDGSDVNQALRIGAKAVGLGRPCAYALSVGGESCLADLLEQFIDDLQQEKQQSSPQERFKVVCNESLVPKVLFDTVCT